VFDIFYFSAKKRKISVMTLTKEADISCDVTHVTHFFLTAEFAGNAEEKTEKNQ